MDTRGIRMRAAHGVPCRRSRIRVGSTCRERRALRLFHGDNHIVEQTSGDDPGSAGAPGLRARLRREVHVLPWIARWNARILVVVGVLLRLAEYLHGRGLWMDEASLAANIRWKTLPGLFGPLDYAQLAPPGFLAVEWIAARLLGPSTMVLRLFPL